jgi:hypothetical protein
VTRGGGGTRGAARKPAATRKVAKKVASTRAPRSGMEMVDQLAAVTKQLIEENQRLREQLTKLAKGSRATAVQKRLESQARDLSRRAKLAVERDTTAIIELKKSIRKSQVKSRPAVRVKKK